MLFTNTIITSSFLLSYVVFLAGKKIVYKKRKEKIIYPWCIKDPYDPLSEYKFSKKHLTLLIMGGVTEFLGNILLTLSFKGAIEGHFNTGICNSLLVSNTIMVLLLSYFFFREKVLRSQIMGCFVLLFSIVIVSLFRIDGQTGWEDHHSEGEMQYSGGHYMPILLGGLGASFLFGSQTVFFKEQMKRCEDPFFSAFTFLLFCGVLGALSFIYFLVFEFEIFQQLTLLQYFSSIGTGICISIAIGMINVASSQGTEGVSMAVNHT